MRNELERGKPLGTGAGQKANFSKHQINQSIFAFLALAYVACIFAATQASFPATSRIYIDMIISLPIA